MGIPLDEMVVWDPWGLQGGQTKAQLAASRVLLWKGHCAVHQRFLPSHVDDVRAKYPGIQVIVHPECRWEVCQKADALGSTERLIALVEQAPEGQMFAVGTEIHLVNRMARRFAAAGQARHHPGRYRLPVHHHVPHQPAAPGLGSGKPGRGPRGQPHPGAPQRQALGESGAGPHAGDSEQLTVDSRQRSPEDMETATGNC